MQHFKGWWNVQDLDVWAPAIKMAHAIETSMLTENFRGLDSWQRGDARLPIHILLQCK